MCGLGFRYAEACKNVSKCFVCTNLFNPATLSSNDATQEAPPYETNQSPLALMDEECAKSSLPTLHLPSSVPAWLLLLKGVQQSHSHVDQSLKTLIFMTLQLDI